MRRRSWGLAWTRIAWPISLLLAFVSLGSVSVADMPDLTARATSGDRNAQISLGIAYRDGKGVARNYAEALAWFRKAAEKDEAAALDNLGWMYEHGFGTSTDLAAAARYYRASADKGHAQGQWNLGRMYAETAWGRYDNAEAARWYRRAAEGGHAWAQYRLGLAYLQGMGGAADNAQAREWFLKSANQGNAEAMLALGTLYCLGSGVDRNDERARDRFAKAAGQRDEQAADALNWLDLRRKPAVAGKSVCLKVPHISQGWNMCGVASATMATAFHGKTGDQYEVKRLCGSPMGDGTDWMDLIAAAAKLGCRWELKTFPYDQAGFRDGCKRMVAWLDSGHPILLDITVERPGRAPPATRWLLWATTRRGNGGSSTIRRSARLESRYTTCRRSTSCGTRGGIPPRRLERHARSF